VKNRHRLVQIPRSQRRSVGPSAGAVDEAKI
jgi:hypothetical protein